MYHRQRGSQHRQQKNRRYSIKKTSIKDENIDRQIIAIHQAIAEKLLADVALVEQIKNRLEAQREQGKIGYGQFINWYSILELIDQPSVFTKAMIEDTPKMRRLRRNTPFVGILTEAEREEAINRNALGFIDSIAVIL